MIVNQSRPSTYLHHNQNIFLTSTFGGDDIKKEKYRQKLTSINEGGQSKDKEVQNLKKSIINIVLQFKSLPNSFQLTHQFNQILYSLDTQTMEKKTITNIISSLKTQTNVIKLNRLLNRLNALKKQLSKIKIQKSQQKTINKSYSSQGFRKHLVHNQTTNVTCLTLPNQNKQNQQWKQQIIDQISYRQRISKIQSKSQKHSLNKERFMKKKLLKVKEMNKKVTEIYQKNTKLHKQKINNYKYQQLFDPTHLNINAKRRAQMMNLNQQHNQSQANSEIDIVSDEFMTQPMICNPKNGSSKTQLFNSVSKNNINKKDFLFDSRNVSIIKSQDITTLKTLNDLVNPTIKPIKSSHMLFKQNESKPNQNLLKTKSYYCTPLTKSYSFDKNLSNTFRKNPLNSSQRYNEKLLIVKQKKQQQEKQKINKMIIEAVQKQKKILKIHQQKNLDSKNKKISKQKSISNDDLERSFDIIQSKRALKKRIISDKQMMEKERQIFININNKIQKKDLFLQERVNRIRERLQRQEETKQNHKRYWQEYMSLTESASVFQSKNLSPSKSTIKNKNFSTDKKRQEIIRSSFLKKLKQNEVNLKSNKLPNLSLDQLKKKLIHIQNMENNTSQKSLFF